MGVFLPAVEWKSGRRRRGSSTSILSLAACPLGTLCAAGLLSPACATRARRCRSSGLHTRSVCLKRRDEVLAGTNFGVHRRPLEEQLVEEPDSFLI